MLRAASELLMEVDVADRAGVHKTTVYRRLPTKPELVFDAAGEQSAEPTNSPTRSPSWSLGPTPLDRRWLRSEPWGRLAW